VNSRLAWRIIASSAIGTSHLASGSICQDAHAYRLLEDGTLLIAVGDGAGSASHSAEGARCATDTAINFLAGRLSKSPDQDVAAALAESLSAARGAVERLATKDLSAADFATTMLIAVVTAAHISIAQVGDGAIVIQHQDESLEVLTKASDSEYINQTTFITSPDALEQAYFNVRPSNTIRGIAVLTDGMQLLAIHHRTNSAFEAFFGPMFRFAADTTSNSESLEEFLMSAAVSSRTDDDKTLVFTIRV
jgi:hypothetical protein